MSAFFHILVSSSQNRKKICRLTNKMYLHTVATFSGVLIGNDIEHAAVSAYL